MYAKTTWLDTPSTITPINSTNLNILETQYTKAIVIGEIMPWIGTIAPNNYLLCDGSTYDGASTTYSALYAVTSKYFGGGAGSTFYVPDMRGKYPAGLGSGDYSTMGKTGGSSGITLTVASMPSHRHGFDSYIADMSWGFKGISGSGVADQSANSGYVGGDNPHENRPQSIVMNFVIRYR